MYAGDFTGGVQGVGEAQQGHKHTCQKKSHGFKKYTNGRHGKECVYYHVMFSFLLKWHQVEEVHVLANWDSPLSTCIVYHLE